MYDISIILPTIRTHLLEDLYNSICKSCDRHSFELICVGPFDIPKSLSKLDNIKYIKDYGSPTRCMQIALTNAKGTLIHPLVDDCFYYPKTLSTTINIFNHDCKQNDILGMRFFENPEHYKAIKEKKTTEQQPELRNKCHPDAYWYAGPSYGYLRGVNPNWGAACLFIANTNLIKDFGGWDCQFEYINHATHDLLFRLQKYGSHFLLTQYDCFVADWKAEGDPPGTATDHAPIHYGQLTHDIPLFQNIWQYPNNRGKIQLNNWENTPTKWTRRFVQGQPINYDEMIKKYSQEDNYGQKI